MTWTRNRALPFALCALVTVTTGCPKPSEAGVESMAALEQPDLIEIAADGAELPEPDVHLQLAREGLDEAERLDRRGRSEKAYSRLLRAQADAELAMILAVGMSQSLMEDMRRLGEPAPTE